MSEKIKSTPPFIRAMQKAIKETKDPERAKYGRNLISSAYEYHREKVAEQQTLAVSTTDPIVNVETVNDAISAE